MIKKSKYKSIFCFPVAYLMLQLFCISLTGCFLHNNYDAKKSNLETNSINNNKINTLTSEESLIAKYGAMYPWELIMFASSPNINQSVFVYADETYKSQKIEEALQQYRSLYANVGLQSEDKIIFIRRIAGALLTLNQSSESLNTLSSFFKNNNISTKAVKSVDALMLGYAYAQADDSEQSLAWLTKAFSDTESTFEVKELSTSAVKKLATYLNADQLSSLSLKWKSDSFINTYLDEEKTKRGSNPQPNVNTNPFKTKFQYNNQDNTSKVIPNTEKQIVAVLLPLSGKLSTLGNNTKKGIELANQNSGIEFEFVDSPNFPEEAASQIRDIVYSKKIAGIIGPLLSDSADAVAKVAEEANIPILNLSKKETFAQGRYTYRLGITLKSQVISLLRSISATRNYNQIALISTDDAYGNQLSEIIKSELPSFGMTLGYENRYSVSDTSQFPYITQDIESKGIQAIIFTDKIYNASRFFSLFSDNFRQNIVPIGLANWDNPTELLQSRNALDGALYVSPFNTATEKPKILSFIDTYKASYNRMPDFLSAQGYDAAMIFAKSLEACSSSKIAGEINTCLSQIYNFDGITGLISITGTGEFDREYSIVEFKGGTFKEKSYLIQNVDKKY